MMNEGGTVHYRSRSEKMGDVTPSAEGVDAGRRRARVTLIGCQPDGAGGPADRRDSLESTTPVLRHTTPQMTRGSAGEDGCTDSLHSINIKRPLIGPTGISAKLDRLSILWSLIGRNVFREMAQIALSSGTGSRKQYPISNQKSSQEQ